MEFRAVPGRELHCSGRQTAVKTFFPELIAFPDRHDSDVDETWTSSVDGNRPENAQGCNCIRTGTAVQ